jgi:DNA repair protein RadC
MSAEALPYESLPWIRIQLVRERAPTYPDPITSAERVYGILRERAEGWDPEHFLLLALDGKGRVLALHEVSVGTLTASLVHPREVIKALVLLNAASFILVHNHPSGDPTASPEDASTPRLLSTINPALP